MDQHFGIRSHDIIIEQAVAHDCNSCAQIVVAEDIAADKAADTVVDRVAGKVEDTAADKVADKDSAVANVVLEEVQDLVVANAALEEVDAAAESMDRFHVIVLQPCRSSYRLRNSSRQSQELIF